jgi:UDP-N-acetylmuramyl tripeptide synthase
METIIIRLAEALEAFNGKLVLNGDDPNVARLGLKTSAEVIYFGLAQYEGNELVSDEALEGGFCPECGSKLLYEFYQYSHVGSFLCEICSFGSFDIKYIVDEISFTEGFFVHGEKEFGLLNICMFGVYNAIGVIAVTSEGDIDNSFVAKVLEKFTLGNGRMEVFEFGDKKCLLNLVKNPTGANEVMKYIQSDEREKEVLIVLNDGTADGKDVSWIWDTRFDLITTENVNKIICAGTRCYDIATRIKYLGYDMEQISVQKDLSAAVDELASGCEATYVLASYTGLQAVRKELGRASTCALMEIV